MMNLLVSMLVLLGVLAAEPAPPATPPTSRPAAEDATPGPVRRPFQDDILRTLLNNREAPEAIPPIDPGSGTPLAPGPDTSNLMLEGTRIVERPGQLLRLNDRTEFSFRLPNGERVMSIELLPNSLLEAMERQADSGVGEFVVSGEVTRYRGRNFLLVQKVVQRVNNGNLSP